MNRAETPTRIHRPLRATVATVTALIVVVLAILGNQYLQGLSFTPTFSSQNDSATSEPGGELPDGVRVFNDEHAGVANLNPALLRAVREAATEAEAERGIKFTVNSGWRSPAYQDQLLSEAVSKYGTVEEASRWVATADTSSHVSGDAIDIGGPQAANWLSEHGAAYGLCQTYINEPWHYELHAEAPEVGCPQMYADPTHDPRMQQ
ncbi:M15 family metallopeptidase [Brevibacterium linens]|uniref:M15 family metallopeptidase n=1 Tax=Brevibacterium linens TaxID=1703 RepID=UPI003BF4F3AF